MNKILTLALMVFVLVSCKKSDDTPEEVNPGSMSFRFDHHVNGQSLRLDTLIYTNAAGNHFKVTDLQYFVSDLILHRKDGITLSILTRDGIHYIDERLPETKTWQPEEQIAAGEYDSLRMTFGINEVKNVSNRFPNPPERDMAWPDILGGGYHYMKMNMMWKSDTMSQPMPFMFHLGIGQIYSGVTPDPDSITGYVQNYFTVNLPLSFMVGNGEPKEITITMDIDQWFGAEEVFDFTQYPMMIMQDQPAMEKGCRNGRHAFSGLVE